MPALMGVLHPDIDDQQFDLTVLAQYEPPVDWIPEEGETLRGTVTHRLTTRIKGSEFPMLYIMGEDAVFYRVRCSALVYRKNVEEKNIREGHDVAITYHGMKTSQNTGREYKNASFVVTRG